MTKVAPERRYYQYQQQPLLILVVSSRPVKYLAGAVVGAMFAWVTRWTGWEGPGKLGKLGVFQRIGRA